MEREKGPLERERVPDPNSNSNPNSKSNPNPNLESNPLNISTIFVSNLPLFLDVFGFRGIFSKIGRVEEVSIPGKQAGRSRFGFVKFHNHGDAIRSIRVFNNKLVRGVRIWVHLAKRDFSRARIDHPSVIRHQPRSMPPPSGNCQNKEAEAGLLDSLKKVLTEEVSKLGHLRKALESILGMFEALVDSKSVRTIIGVLTEVAENLKAANPSPSCLKSDPVLKSSSISSSGGPSGIREVDPGLCSVDAVLEDLPHLKAPPFESVVGEVQGFDSVEVAVADSLEGVETEVDVEEGEIREGEYGPLPHPLNDEELKEVRVVVSLEGCGNQNQVEVVTGVDHPIAAEVADVDLVDSGGLFLDKKAEAGDRLAAADLDFSVAHPSSRPLNSNAEDAPSEAYDSDDCEISLASIPKTFSASHVALALSGSAATSSSKNLVSDVLDTGSSKPRPMAAADSCQVNVVHSYVGVPINNSLLLEQAPFSSGVASACRDNILPKGNRSKLKKNVKFGEKRKARSPRGRGSSSRRRFAKRRRSKPESIPLAVEIDAPGCVQTEAAASIRLESPPPIVEVAMAVVPASIPSCGASLSADGVDVGEVVGESPEILPSPEDLLLESNKEESRLCPVVGEVVEEDHFRSRALKTLKFGEMLGMKVVNNKEGAVLRTARNISNQRRYQACSSSEGDSQLSLEF